MTTQFKAYWFGGVEPSHGDCSDNSKTLRDSYIKRATVFCEQQRKGIGGAFGKNEEWN